MVPALIIAALVALLWCAAASYVHSAENQFTPRNHGMTTTFVSALASMPIGGSTASARMPRGGRRATLINHIAKVVFTSINFRKFSSGRREAFRWPQSIPLAEDSIRPAG